MIATKFENFDVEFALLDMGAKIDQPKVDIDRFLLDLLVASSER